MLNGFKEETAKIEVKECGNEAADESIADLYESSREVNLEEDDMLRDPVERSYHRNGMIVAKLTPTPTLQATTFQSWGESFQYSESYKGSFGQS